MVATGQIIALLGTKLKYLGKPKAVIIDNFAFRLHYQFTFLILWISCIVVTSTQFFGDPINCVRSAQFVDQRIINNYCWIEGTFTLPKALTKIQGEEVVMPGIEKYNQDDQVLKHQYYQWVCWVLFLQGICFYLPRLIWKIWENGYINKLIQDLNKCILDDVKKKQSSECVVQFLKERQGFFDRYAIKYTICEVFNFLNVWIQIWITNTFLGGLFYSYGYDVMAYDNNPDEVNPLTKIFPKMTKCTFRLFGSSGDVQKYDNYCLLPLNIINEKVYLVLWFWYFFLAFVTTLSLVYRILSFFYPPSRFTLLKLRSKRRGPPSKVFNTLLNNLSYGDWFFLSILGKNYDPIHYYYVLSLLSRQLDGPSFDEPDTISSKVTSSL